MKTANDYILKKKDLIRKVAKETGYMIVDVTEVINTLFEIIDKQILDGGDCNLGSIYFGCKLVETKEVKDPRTQLFFTKKQHLSPYVKILPGFKRKFKTVERERALNEDEE